MKSLSTIISGIMVVACVHSAAGQNAALQWSGYLHADQRLYLKEPYEYSWHEYRLDLQAECRPVSTTRLFVECWVRNLGMSEAARIYDLGESGNTRPLDISIREAYIDLYGIPWNKMDLRLGRQRIAWGTADRLNPTDNIDPDDLEDIWNFGRHLGSDALQARVYLKGYTFTGVFIPMFTPARLPATLVQNLLFSGSMLPDNTPIHTLYDSLLLPENTITQSSKTGIKINRRIGMFDMSVSYVQGRDDLPLMNELAIMPHDTLGSMDIHAVFTYPRMHIAGCDMAGELFGLGVWAEAAMFLPEEVVMSIDLSALGMGITDSIVLPEEPYVKLCAGFDYTFANESYVNIQYLHGFVNEQGRDNLRDYLVVGTEVPLFNHTVKIMPLAGGIEIGDIRDIQDSYAIIYAPEVHYYPVDNAELSLGWRVIDGKESSSFGRMKDQDEMFFRVKYSF